MTTEISQLYQKVGSSDGLDRMLPLEAIIECAQDSGNLREMPETEKGFRNHPDLIIRMKKRLFHLGYLGKLRESSHLSKEDHRAIQAFQAEAGITADGWVGHQTWQVMEDLFGFEADSHIQRWTSDERFLPLLRRAVQLRLFTFSLLKVSPKEELTDPLPGLQAFVDLVNRYGFSSTPLKADYSFETLDLVFDQSRITQCLATLPSDTDLDKSSRLKAFVVCNAKIELWLLGYPIVPDGKGNYKKPARRRRRPKGAPGPNRYATFYKVLGDFCKDVNPGRDSKLSAGRFGSQFTGFFQEFSDANYALADGVDIMNPEMLVETIRLHPEEAQKEWENQRSFAGRLWDGVIRAWGWIKRLFKKTVGVVTTLVRNVIRVVWSLAIHSVAVVKAAIRSFPDAVGYFLRSEVRGSDKDAIVYTHDKDFDWRVYVAPKPSRESIDKVIDTLQEQVTRFTFSLRLVGLLVKALIKNIRFIPSGYLAIFVAIAQIRPDLDEFLDYFEVNKTTLLT